MDRLDRNSFQKLLQEATSVLSNKSVSNNMSLNEAVDTGLLTEQEMEAIQNFIFEQTILIPAVGNLAKQIEDYHGIELSEEQLNELRAGLAALAGSALGSITRGVKTAAKKTAGAVKSAASAVAKPIGGAVRSAMDTYAAGEKAGAEAKVQQAKNIEAAPTALGKVKAAVPMGKGLAAGFKAGVNQSGLHSVAKQTGHGNLESLKAKLKAKGYKGKVSIKNVGGKLHVNGEELADSYIFTRENGELILENIIRK
jgi:hypothetical protein